MEHTLSDSARTPLRVAQDVTETITEDYNDQSLLVSSVPRTPSGIAGRSSVASNVGLRDGGVDVPGVPGERFVVSQMTTRTASAISDQTDGLLDRVDVQHAPATTSTDGRDGQSSPQRSSSISTNVSPTTSPEVGVDAAGSVVSAADSLSIEQAQSSIVAAVAADLAVYVFAATMIATAGGTLQWSRPAAALSCRVPLQPALRQETMTPLCVA